MKNNEPEGEGVFVKAVDFIQGNLTYNADFGLVIDGGVLPAYAVYEVNLPYAGDYELWVRYATMAARPVDIYLDGILKKSAALGRFTEGWTYADARWSQELNIKTTKGRHSIKLITHKTPFPHIDAIKLIYKSK